MGPKRSQRLFLQPLNREKNQKDAETMGSIITIEFCLITTLCFLHALEQVKQYAFGFAAKGDIYSYIEFAFYLSLAIEKISFLKFLLNNEKYSRYFSAKEELDKFNGDSSADMSKEFWYDSILFGLCLCMSAGATLFDVHPWSNWNFKAFMQSKYCVVVFLWNGDLRCQQQTDDVDLIDPVFILVSILGILIRFIGHMENIEVIDSLLLDVSVVRKGARRFVQSHENMEVEELQKLTSEDAIKQWSWYTAMKEMCNSVNDGLGGHIKLRHVTNLLHLIYFILRRLRGEPMLFLDFMLMVGIVKIGWFYWAAVDAIKCNDICHDWMCKWKADPYFETDNVLPMLYKDLTLYPIGIGEKNFLIDETFLLKVAALLAIIFMVISAAATPKQCRRFLTESFEESMEEDFIFLDEYDY